MVRQGVVVAGLGVAAGTAVAALVGQLLTGVLFGVTAIDLPAYGIAALALLAIAVGASYLPAGGRRTSIRPRPYARSNR